MPTTYKHPHGEVKAVIVRDKDGTITGQRRNTRRYTHALVWHGGIVGHRYNEPRVLTYHTREDLAHARHRSGECENSPRISVVATEIVEHPTMSPAGWQSDADIETDDALHNRPQA
jgi:hypothetical protein